MTDWQAYVRDIADRIGLKDWVIVLGDEPADDGNDAQIKCIYGHQRAMLWLDPEFADFTPDKQRGTIVHELIHCHLARMSHASRHVESVLGPVAGPLFSSVIEDGEEQAAESLAVVLALAKEIPNDDQAAKFKVDVAKALDMPPF